MTDPKEEPETEPAAARIERVNVDAERPSLLDLVGAEEGDGAESSDSRTKTIVDVPKTVRPPGGTAQFHERYEVLSVLGTGGMGEVLLCHDRNIGRDVAMKVIRKSHEMSPRRWRFIREARVQGQLEHPAVVPLYDLGLDPDGNLYFTMKRIRGKSLKTVLAEQLAGTNDPRFSRRRLLSRFTQVCLAVDFIHSAGVIHRDLKPTNVMLGDFGEVYVLDWGIAKLLTSTRNDRERPLIDASGASVTGRGSVLGTPRYMAPEQLRGEVDAVGPRSDVYSLGAILFEILTLEKVHAQEQMQGRLLSVLSTDGAKPSERAPWRNIPAALDAICVAATRQKPADRFASASAMSNAIETFLDQVSASTG